jgi:hypothetical protein
MIHVIGSRQITPATFCLFALLMAMAFDLATTRLGFDSAKFRSRSHEAVIRVYDEPGNVIETHDHTGDFKECSLREARSIMTPALPNIT